MQVKEEIKEAAEDTDCTEMKFTVMCSNVRLTYRLRH